MKKQAIIISVILVAGINLLGCRSSDRPELSNGISQNFRREKQREAGMPNPSAVYCTRLGYKYEIVADDEGNQYGLCIFPDESACLAWDFYRGKCGQGKLGTVTYFYDPDFIIKPQILNSC
jgi:putative hemolysin